MPLSLIIWPFVNGLDDEGREYERENGRDGRIAARLVRRKMRGGREEKGLP